MYFSPDGGIRQRLLRQINQTKVAIDLAMFDFTAGDLAGALLDARARGVTVRVVADFRQAQGKHSEIPVLLASGVDVRLARGKGRGIMHHKFAVFDGRVVVTGSYNWTNAAEHANAENALFLDDPVLVGRYATLFARLYERASVGAVVPPDRGARPASQVR